MARPPLKRFALVAGCALAAAALALESYGLVRLRAEKQTLEAKMVRTEERQALLEKKYAEEKARTGGLQRARATAESQARSLQARVEELEKKNAELVLRLGSLSEQTAKKLETCEARLKELTGQYDQARKEWEKAEKKWAEALKDSEGKLARVSSEKESVEAELKEETRKRERCETDNAKLAQIMDELIRKYGSKGVVESILQKEPFTQVEKVEMEKMLEEYRDETSRHTLTTPQSSSGPR